LSFYRHITSDLVYELRHKVNVLYSFSVETAGAAIYFSPFSAFSTQRSSNRVTLINIFITAIFIPASCNRKAIFAINLKPFVSSLSS
jgi:hypothetical protein